MSIFLTKQKIKKEWTDYNGHMNVAYYVLIFDHKKLRNNNSLGYTDGVTDTIIS